MLLIICEDVLYYAVSHDDSLVDVAIDIVNITVLW